MAWKWTLACPKCRHFGHGRKEEPCSKCWKKSTTAKPTKFDPRPKEARA